MKRLTLQQWLGISGALLLNISIFLPFFDLPLIGKKSLLNGGDLNGMLAFSLGTVSIVIIVLAALSLLITILNRCRWLFLTGFLSAGIIAYALHMMDKAKTDVKNDFAANFLMNLTHTSVEDGRLLFGIYVIGAAVLLLLVAAVMKKKISTISVA